MHVDAWRGAYRGLLPDELLAALSVEQRERSWAELLGAGRGVVLVAEEGERVVGFCALLGEEVAALYVDPSSWGRGLGGALLREALAAAGERDVVAWVLDGNERALRFYAELGFAPDGATRRDPIGPEGARAEPLQVRLRRPAGG